MSHIYEAEPAPVAKATPATTRKTVEDWAREKGTSAFLFAAARVRHGWPIGRELTEADYDAAIVATQSIRIRG